MGAERPSWHAVLNRDRCKIGPAPLGVWEASSKFFLHFEALGLHFGQVLVNLAFCFSSFERGISCLKDKNIIGF